MKTRYYKVIDWVYHFKCNKCWEIKSQEHFSKHKRWFMWYQCTCKSCTKLYRDNHKDYFKNKMDEWHKNNHEYELEYWKEYRNNNRQLVNKRVRDYYYKNKEKVKEYHYKRLKDNWYKVYNKDNRNVDKKLINYINYNNIKLENKCQLCWCNEWVFENHHYDYSKRNEFYRLCIKCHHKIHWKYETVSLQIKPLNILDF